VSGEGEERAMSDMSTVLVGVVSILSCLALVTYVARPADFRGKVVWPEPPAKVAVPVPSPRVARPIASSWPPPPTPPPIPEAAASEPVPALRAPRPARKAAARSFLYVTKVPTRR
jgi:hypothetical protein